MTPSSSASPKQPESAIPDVVAPGLRVLFCGINPGRVSAAAHAHFANPRNDFWRLLHAAGFTPELLEPSQQFDLLKHGIGVTNAAARTTPGSGDLRKADFAGAADRLEQIARDERPAWIGFVGKEAYRGTFGARPLLGRAGAAARRHAAVRASVHVSRERGGAMGGEVEVVRGARPAELV